MAVLAKVEAHAQAGEVDALLALLDEILPGTRDYDGCLGLEVWQDQDDPSHIVLTERWVARENHERYLAWREETGVLAKIVGMLAGPPDIAYFDEVDA